MHTPTHESTLGGQLELLDETTLRERFPGFNLREGMVATYEANAGFLRPEVGIAAHLEVAERQRRNNPAPRDGHRLASRRPRRRRHHLDWNIPRRAPCPGSRAMVQRTTR